MQRNAGSPLLGSPLETCIQPSWCQQPRPPGTWSLHRGQLRARAWLAVAVWSQRGGSWSPAGVGEMGLESPRLEDLHLRGDLLVTLFNKWLWLEWTWPGPAGHMACPMGGCTQHRPGCRERTARDVRVQDCTPLAALAVGTAAAFCVCTVGLHVILANSTVYINCIFLICKILFLFELLELGSSHYNLITSE